MSGVGEDGLNPQYELTYGVAGVTGMEDALTALKATAPATFAAMANLRNRVRRVADDVWEGQVTYGLTQIPRRKTGESIYTFNTAGGRQRIHRGPEHKGDFAPAGKDGLGTSRGDHTKTARRPGVEHHHPQFEFGSATTCPTRRWGDTYKGKLFKLTGKTNTAIFRGCQIGECLLPGGQRLQAGQQRLGDQLQLRRQREPGQRTSRDCGITKAGGS